MSPSTAKHPLKGKSPLVDNYYLNYRWELFQLKKSLYKTEVEGMTFPKSSSKIAKESSLADYKLKLCPWENLLNWILRIKILK